MAHLTDEQKNRIKAAVADAESKTSGELVPLVVPASDAYSGARWRIAVAVGLGLSTGIVFLVPQLDALFALAAFVPALVVGHLLALWPPVLRLALSRREVTQEVHQKAVESFFELGLHTTLDRTGVLIMISLAERRIEILSDTGIDDKAADDFWQDIVGGLVPRIKRGELTDGLIEAINRCGDLLAEHFPRRKDDVNELPDDVVVE